MSLEDSAAVIGGGPAGLMAAEVMSASGVEVHLYRVQAVRRAEIPGGGQRRVEPDPLGAV